MKKYCLKTILILIIFAMIISFSMANAVTVVKGDDIIITKPVTYSLQLEGKTPEVTLNNSRFIEKDGCIIYKLPAKTTDEQVVGNGTTDLATALYRDAAVNKDGEYFDVLISIKQLKYYDYNIASDDTLKYIGVWGNYRPDVSDSWKIATNNYTLDADFYRKNGDEKRKGTAYDITLQVLDKDGNPAQGTYIFSAYDIDQEHTDGTWGNNKPCEGISLVEGFADDAELHFTNETTLAYSTGTTWGNRVRGTKKDDDTVNSAFSIIADASYTRFIWTAGIGCTTRMLNQYNPQVISVSKVNESGDYVTGVVLRLYRDEVSETNQIEVWESKTTPRTFLLSPGTYVIHESETPKGFNTADDVTFTIGLEGEITSANATGNLISVVNSRKAAVLKVYHYIKSGDTYTTTRVPKKPSGTVGTQTINKFYNDPYETSPSTAISDDYEYVEVVGNPTGTMDKDTVVVKYYYKLKDGEYTVNHLKLSDGSPLADPDTGTAPYTTEISALDYIKTNIKGYKYDSEDNTIITIGSGENVINIYYTLKDCGYTVYHYEVGTENQIAPMESGEAKYGTTIKAVNKKVQIANYAYDHAEKASIKIGEDPSKNVLKLYYAPGKYNYTVNYLDKETKKPIETAKIATADLDQVITANNEVIPIENYTYDSSDKPSVTITTTEDNNVLNLYYTINKYDFVVNHLDKETGDPIANPDQGQEPKGTTIKAEDFVKPDFDGYTYDSEDKAEIVISEDGNTINIYYTLKDCNYEVYHYENGTTKEIAPKEEGTGKYGTIINAIDKKVEVANYAYNHAEKESITLGEDATKNVLKLYYDLGKVNYTVNYLEYKTNKELANPKIGTKALNEKVKASSEKITIKGYSYYGSDVKEIIISENEKNNVINLYYKKATGGGGGGGGGGGTTTTTPTPTPKSEVIVKYIDKVTGQELTTSIDMTGSVSDPYTTDRKAFDGYVLKEVPVNADGVYKNDKIEVIYYYEKAPAYSLLTDDTGHHEWYLRGYEDYTFRMTGRVTREEVATIFYRLTVDAKGDMRQNYTVTSKPYDDVELDRWSVRPIAYMKELGIMNGYEDGTFKPLRPITRAEFAQVIMKYIDTPKKNETMFKDLTSDYWAADAISYASSEGWVKGYEDGTFRPTNNITRVETVTIVNRMLKRGIAKEDVSSIRIPVVDLDPTHWGYADVLEAITSHDYGKDAVGEEHWSDYRYPFHEDMSNDAYNDV